MGRRERTKESFWLGEVGGRESGQFERGLHARAGLESKM